MSRITVTDLMVCYDCLAYAAGITEHEQGRPYPIDPPPWAEYATSGGHAVPTDGTDDFSTSPCEACGQTDAGSRHGAAWLVEEESLDAIEWLTAIMRADLAPTADLLALLQPHLTGLAYAQLADALSTPAVLEEVRPPAAS